MTIQRSYAALGCAFSLLFVWQAKAEPNAKRYDLVVYGSTSAGVTAAIQAAKMDKSVLLINHATHIGGLTSSGLGHTDWGKRHVIGGLSREFYQRVRKVYEGDELWKQEKREQYLGSAWLPKNEDTQWGFEPKVAETTAQ